MSSTETLQTYDYQFESLVDQRGLRCAAATKPRTGADFFTAKLWQPRLVGQMLTVLSRVVQSQFHTFKPIQLDPVVTSHSSMLRFEGFSGCCGVYARVDFDQRAFHELEQSFGTTNVDFNSAMISQLARLGQLDDAKLSVSRDQVALETPQTKVIERKVTLPERWIRGFGEVQVYQSRLVHLWTISPISLTKLFQTMGKSGYGIHHLELHQSTLRPTFRKSVNSVAISGIERLKIIQPLLLLTDQVQVWRDEEESDVTAWQFITKAGSFWLVLSPALQRGFSGEGQALELLAASDWRETIDRLLPWLGERDSLDPAEAASQLGLRVSDVTSGFAAMAAAGMAGFDAQSGYYFQRCLPFVDAKINRFQPRFKNARRLLDGSKVSVLAKIAPTSGNEPQWDCRVEGDSCQYLVRLRSEGDSCTCQWYSRYQGARGACKHVLAAKLFVREQSDD
jgi:hypothetical protein